ncbi:MAG: glutamine--fructose-6-phosphate transaminase (isomerizing) [Candidatus Omnitrophica bacterium]|nr:glutamine--fructose-6-phosphate transaminase (isomerizing) [Candidatus Omnitrophota bacterium]
MCGIIGYIGSREAQPILLNGLKRLEYRGYDSSGIAVISPKRNAISIRKSPGKIKLLEKVLKEKPVFGSVGIGHTRWATHGSPTQGNAHPHADCKNEIAVVHNGIIENFEALKLQLIKEGHCFLSQTDTEVIAHLIGKFYNDIPLEDAVRQALRLLRGSFAVGVISKRETAKMVGARLGSPLILGLGKNENYIASDVPAILGLTRDVIFLEDNEMAILGKDSFKVIDWHGQPVAKKPVHIAWDTASAQKQGYKHFMLKEINEQPQVLENLLNLRIDTKSRKINFKEMEICEDKLKDLKHIFIVACGTAYHAGIVGKYALESLCSIPVSIDFSSEFRYRDLLVGPDTLVIAISQSGETADTLAGAREAKKRGSIVISICNVLGSTLTRESDGVIYTHAGPEIGVASTKAYTAQVLVLYLFAFYLAQIRASMPVVKINRYLDDLNKIPKQIGMILKRQQTIAKLARKHAHFGSFLYLGRNINVPTVLEGALKLKEIAYIPAEGYAAGEMKHGPIALIDEYRAVVCIAVESKVFEKMVSNIQEIKSRKGKVIAIATEGNKEIKGLTSEVVYIPKCEEIFSPLLAVVPLQLLAYHIAVKRGCDADQPRNLAKSVTVE